MSRRQISDYERAKKREARTKVGTSPASHGDRGDSDDEAAKYLAGPAVWERYQISDMTLSRWLRDEKVAFPQPALRVRERRYWLIADLERWERSFIPSEKTSTPHHHEAHV